MTTTTVQTIALPYTGIQTVDAGFNILSQNAARTNSNIQSILTDTDAMGGTTAPTNAPTPTGITVTVNSDGSMDVTLTWNYTQ